ncbi:MAG: carbonic anhydrase [Planctomycetes bacterium]|nr:carbonic anhydrase [Planctomycetota bacterium]
MPMEDFLSANKHFLASFEPRHLSAEPRRRLTVFTCMDTRLIQLVPRAMGLERGDAAFIRTAGAILRPDDHGTIRSIAATVYLAGCREIAVVGHTDCLMASDEERVRAGFGRWGVNPSVLGRPSIREWFALIRSLEDNVRSGVETLRDVNVLPMGIKLLGLLIDTHTGVLTPICESETRGELSLRSYPGATMIDKLARDADV